MNWKIKSKLFSATKMHYDKAILISPRGVDLFFWSLHILRLVRFRILLLVSIVLEFSLGRQSTAIMHRTYFSNMNKFKLSVFEISNNLFSKITSLSVTNFSDKSYLPLWIEKSSHLWEYLWDKYHQHTELLKKNRTCYKFYVFRVHVSI